ncbi:MAG: hypothetical protein N3F04_02725 [Candidatus Nezhaarchaeota archaeon]|nr:hypothetical protein [Candidatus Nezhaarchaeota archaeon]MCX8141685.1 hypothetical protein [Candidatus Nezhaarchaeota archaeon]MDW8049952.1 V-type ATPase 116kDa subunit family protein [Nitrososphaerota archaeon]
MPLAKVNVYVHRKYLDKTLLSVGKEGILHLIDAREELAEEIAKRLVKPLETSATLYRISTLISKVEKLISTLKLTPKGLLEDICEDDISKFSLPDSEALVDFIDRLIASADESTMEKVRKEHGEQLLKLLPLLKVLESIESAKAKMVETATTAVFVGWVPKSHLEHFTSIVQRSSNGNSVIKYEEAVPHIKERHLEKVEETRHEILNLRFYIPKEHVDEVVYALSEVDHSIIDLREIAYSEFKEKVKPFEPSPKLFKISSLSSRLDVLLSSLGITPPSDIAPLNRPLPEEEINGIDSSVSIIESEVFSLVSRLESIKKSMETTSKIESEVSTIALPRIPSTESMISDVRGTLKSVMLQLSDEVTKIHQSLDKIKSEKGNQLVEFKRIIEGARIVEEKKLKMLMTDNVAILQLTVFKENKGKLLAVIEKATNNNFVCKEVGPPKKIKTVKKMKEEQRQELKVPSLMRNPSWARVYEGLVRSFGILNYREIDPSIIWFFTFPVFFGIMFPDVGHGLVLLFFSLLLYYFKRKYHSSIKDGGIISYVLQGAPLLIASAITSIFFGLLFGEFFGNPHSSGYPLPNVLDNTTINNFRAVALKALGLSTSYHFHLMEPEGAKALLKLSLYIAIIHISLGLVFSIINKIRLREYKEAIIGPGLWLWLYLSAATAFILYGGRIINIVFTDIVQSIIFIWLPFTVMVIARMIFIGPIDGLSESLDSFIASLSNTISYSRLFAFAITHVVLAHVFVLIDAGLQSMIGVPFIGIVSGTVFFVFFEIVFVFLQALRLHWVEHGLKFLVANGTPFQPFVFKI